MPDDSFETSIQPDTATVPRWEHFRHEADVGVRGIGHSPQEAFVSAAQAMTTVISDLAKITPETDVAIQCQAEDLELLFYDWLNAIIYEIDTRHMIFREFEIQEFDGLSLKARLRGEKLDREKHSPTVELKGATMTELKVHQRDGLWIAQCVVDV